MAANIETMAYTGTTPWHGLGNRVSNDLTPDEMAVAAGIDWTVSVRPVTTRTSDGKFLPIKGFKAIVRDSDDRVFGHCGPRYVPVQNSEALDFFSKFVEAGNMRMETAGALDNGKLVWGLANINESFELVSGDKVEGYVLIYNPHVFGKSMQIMFTPIRVVCMNTLMMALDSKVGNVFNHRHNKKFGEDVRELAEEALGLSSSRMEEFKETSEILLNTKVTDDLFNKFMARVFVPKAEVGGIIDTNEFNRTVRKVSDLVETQPGAEFGAGTLWQLFNATTYYYDHEYGRTDDSRLTAAWFGQSARIKQKALTVARDLAVA